MARRGGSRAGRIPPAPKLRIPPTPRSGNVPKAPAGWRPRGSAPDPVAGVGKRRPQ